MGMNVFYKVRANREENGDISVSEKGLLRHLRTSGSRTRLRQYAEKYLQEHKNEKAIFALYVWDLGDGQQIACFDRETSERINL